MKKHLKELAAIILTIILVLSTVGMAEGDADSARRIKNGTRAFNEELSIESESESKLQETVQELEYDTDIPEDTDETVAPEVVPEEVDVEIGVNELIMDAIPSKITIGMKEKYKVDISGMSGKVSFETSNSKVAVVSQKGVVTAKGVGTAKISILVDNKMNSTKKVITVKVAKAPDMVTLNHTDSNLIVGETLKLKAKLPKKTASYKLKWKSSNSRIATVDEDGYVTAVSPGSATITVSTFNGKKAKCTVTVENDQPFLTVSVESVFITVGESRRITVTYTGYDDIYWSSDDRSIAVCEWEDGWDGDLTGLYIKGVSAGRTVITVYDKKGHSAKVTVTVTGSALIDVFDFLVDNIYKVNAQLTDKLVYVGDGYYSNLYFTAGVDYDNDIVSILLSDGGGKYTLLDVYPGEWYSDATAALAKKGWSLNTISSGVYFYRSVNWTYRTVCVKYTSGKVEYIAVIFG